MKALRTVQALAVGVRFPVTGEKEALTTWVTRKATSSLSELCPSSGSVCNFLCDFGQVAAPRWASGSPQERLGQLLFKLQPYEHY